MPRFKYNGPTGPFEVEAADQDAADAMLPKIAEDMAIQEKRVSAKPVGAPYKRPIPTETYPHPSEEMGMGEKLAAGIGGGIRNVYLGAKNLVGLGTPEDQEEREYARTQLEKLGVPGMVGEGAGEFAATLPVGGPIGKAGQVLTKAVPQLGKLAKYGYGRVANLGTAARAGAEGALSAGIIGDAGDRDIRDRLDNVTSGGLMGLGAPTVTATAMLPLKGAAGAAKGLYRATSPLKGAVERRAYESFLREMGDEGMANAQRSIMHQGPSLLPKSTAALTGDPNLAALERGANQRRNVDFPSHYQDVGLTAWRELMNPAGGKAPSEGIEMLEQTFKRNGVPITDEVVGRGVLPPELQEPFLQDRPLRQAIGKLSNAMRPEEIAQARGIADELGQYEAARYGPGRPTPAGDPSSSLVSAGLAIASAGTGSPMLWKVRSAFNALTGGSSDKTVKAMDEALLDPQRFLDLTQRIQAKADKGHPLSKGELALQQVLLGAGRQAAVKPMGE